MRRQTDFYEIEKRRKTSNYLIIVLLLAAMLLTGILFAAKNGEQKLQLAQNAQEESVSIELLNE